MSTNDGRMTAAKAGSARQPARPIKRLAVIGVGLIGGSFARALRRASLVDEIVGCGRNQNNLDRAMELGVIDASHRDPAAAVVGADLVFISIPVASCDAVFTAIRAALAPAAIITDAGSTKGNVVDAAQRTLGDHGHRFVPGHPIAGTEQTGVDASFAELFDDRRVILTPTADTNADAVQQVQGLWEACGARVDRMAADHHDEVLAATSHLPHILAYQLVAMLAGMDEQREIFTYAAGGFRDFTRIASSSPDMWHDIVTANRDALLPVIERFRTEFAELEAAIRSGDSESIRRCFERAKRARDQFAANEGKHIPKGDLE